jgi:hypothetical protein
LKGVLNQGCCQLKYADRTASKIIFDKKYGRICKLFATFLQTLDLILHLCIEVPQRQMLGRDKKDVKP